MREAPAVYKRGLGVGRISRRLQCAALRSTWVGRARGLRCGALRRCWLLESAAVRAGSLGSEEFPRGVGTVQGGLAALKFL
jgi:hypothetical protein